MTVRPANAVLNNKLALFTTVAKPLLGKGTGRETLDHDDRAFKGAPCKERAARNTRYIVASLRNGDVFAKFSARRFVGR